MDRSKKHNTVVINGRVYDANTGELVNNQDIKTHAKQSHNHQKKTIDGFVRPKNSGPVIKTKQRSHPTPLASKVHKKTKRSETLQRQILKKPQAHPRVESKSVSRSIIQPEKHSGLVINSHEAKLRERRAKKYSLSNAISKFGQDLSLIGFAKHSQPVQNVTPQQSTVSASKPAKVLKNELIKEQMSKAKPARISSKTQKNTSKKQPKILKKLRSRPKLVTGLATFTSVVLLAGYITYLNIPNLSMRVAASRAGFNAKMPGYTPTGFAFSGPISYSAGQITIGFNTNTDERKYSIIQKSSGWDSRSLFDNFVAKEHQLYQTYKERGLTIYVYNGSSATWVNGGVWYTIEGDSSLNSEQIVKIASSL